MPIILSFPDKKALLLENGIEVEDLDGIVHDVKSLEATAINNRGIDEQLSFLFQKGLTTEEILDRLDNE